MRRLLISTLAVAGLGLGTAAAMAQSAPPVPNGSGSQVTNPNAVGSTANDYLMRQDNTETTGSILVAPNSPMPATGWTPPVPNGSGSQVTDPEGHNNSVTEQMQR